MRFLIVDDHKIIRDGLKRILEEYYPSAIVEECGSAEDIRAKMTVADFDLVICDLNLPGRSGLEVARELKSSHPKLPVLILSMNPEENYAVRALEAGAAGYVNKTSGSEELIRAIQQVSLGKKYFSAAAAQIMVEQLISPKKALQDKLTNREFDVLKLISQGRSLAEISKQLFLAPSTVSTHRVRILRKLQVKSNADLIRYAMENKII